MAKTRNNLNLGMVAAGLDRIMTDPDAGTRQITRVMRGFAAVFVPLYLVFIY